MSPILSFVAPSMTEVIIFACAAAIPVLFTLLLIRYVSKRTAKGSSDK